MTEEFRKKVSTAVFTSNPCRIQYCTQEIVVFREDIVTKMCRNCVKFPEDGDVPKHVGGSKMNWKIKFFTGQLLISHIKHRFKYIR